MSQEISNIETNNIDTNSVDLNLNNETSNEINSETTVLTSQNAQTSSENLTECINDKEIPKDSENKDSENIITESTTNSDTMDSVTTENNDASTEETAKNETNPKDSEKNEDSEKNQKNKIRNEKIAKLNAVFEELKIVKENNDTIEVEVISRIKGGLRVTYKDVEIFLPTSHFTLKRNASEAELQEAIGNKYEVEIHELEVSESGRKAIIVSRKNILAKTFFSKYKVGDIVKGKVTFVANFGVFVDIEGLEGLIHISRISYEHIEDPNTLFKVGDEVESKIVEINKSKNRLGLSKKALEPSAWDKYTNEIKEGDIINAVIKRFTDVGIYMEVKPGIDGLARRNELSWTKRITLPSDSFEVGQEVQVQVMDFKPEKHILNLSIKRALPNPWETILTKYPIGSEVKGIVNQMNNKGLVVSIGEFDAFMPNSKARLAEVKKFDIGDNIEAKITDIVIEKETIIIEPLHQVKPEQNQNNKFKGEKFEKDFDRDSRPDKYSSVNPKDLPTAAPISFMDLLSDKDKEIFLNQIDSNNK